MAPAPAPLALPDSYEKLSLQEIRISHHPAGTPSPTPIVVLTLYRPGRNNAFTGLMTTELEHVFQLFDVDERVKCIVMTGHGRIFCAGADLESEFRRDPNENVNDHRDG